MPAGRTPAACAPGGRAGGRAHLLPVSPMYRSKVSIYHDPPPPLQIPHTPRPKAAETRPGAGRPESVKTGRVLAVCADEGKGGEGGFDRKYEWLLWRWRGGSGTSTVEKDGAATGGSVPSGGSKEGSEGEKDSRGDKTGLGTEEFDRIFTCEQLARKSARTCT